MKQKELSSKEFGPNADAAKLTGNKEAAAMADKAKAALEHLVSPALTTRLSELPTTEARLMALADAIEQQELVKHGIGFNLNTWWNDHNKNDRNRKNNFQDQKHTCGSVACIAGWAVALDKSADHQGDDLRFEMNNTQYISTKARNILGITEATAARLFTPWSIFHINHKSVDITPARAVAVIRNLAKTGWVEWNKFGQDGKERT